jgi:BON domain
MGATKDVRAAVQAELTFDPLVDARDITVRNINGEVGLNGTVPSYPQYLAAAAAAQRVAGVKNVHNHLAVVLPDAGYRDDAWLTTAASNAGLVEFGRQREAAERAVAGLTGDADPVGATRARAERARPLRAGRGRQRRPRRHQGQHGDPRPRLPRCHRLTRRARAPGGSA